MSEGLHGNIRPAKLHVKGWCENSRARVPDERIVTRLELRGRIDR